MQLAPEALIVCLNAAFARVPGLALLLVEGSPPEAQTGAAWIWQHPDWLWFHWDQPRLQPLLHQARQTREHLLVQLNALEAPLAR